MKKLSPISPLLLIFFCTCTIGYSQSKCLATLSGKVQDENNQGLPQATITLFPTNKSVVSDTQGYFQLTAICPGKYQIEVRFIGYKTIRQQYTLNQSLIQTFSMVKKRTLLNEVVIEDKANLAKASKNYTTLSSVQLERIQNKSLGELLAKGMAGLNTIQTGPTIFKPMIHGMHSQRILILNDGLRLSGQQWGAEHAPEVDPFVASHITVVKDAGVIKHGAGALGGVIIITPRKLPKEAGIGGEVSLIGASNGLSGLVTGMVEGGFNKIKGLGWRMQGKITKSGDAHTPDYVLSNTGFEEYNYVASVGFHNKKLGIESTYSSFNTQLGILRGSVVGSINNLEIAMESEPPLFTHKFTYAIDNPRQEVKHNVLNIKGNYKSDQLQYHLQYGLQVNKRKEFDVRRGNLNNIPAINLSLVTHSIDVEVEYPKKKKHTRSIGVNGILQNNDNIPGTQRIPFIPNYLYYSLGLYDIEYIKFKKILLEIGLRYDYNWCYIAGRDFRNVLFHHVLNFNSFSGTVGLDYFMTPYLMLTTNMGIAWRPPTMPELYSLGTHQSVATIEYGLLLHRETTEVLDPSQANIKSEQAIKWVSTLRYEKEKWYGEVSGHVNYIFNYIYLKPQGVTQTIRGVFPYFRYTQTNASFVGVDLTGEYLVHPLLKLNTKISWLHATDEGAKGHLISMPANWVELGAHYERKISDKGKIWFVTAKTKYVMRQYRAPQTVTISTINEAYEKGVDIVKNIATNIDFLPSPDGYFLAEVSAGITIPIKHSKLDVRLSVENLFNTPYRAYTNRMRYYADERGRNFTLTLHHQF